MEQEHREETKRSFETEQSSRTEQDSEIGRSSEINQDSEISQDSGIEQNSGVSQESIILKEKQGVLQKIKKNLKSFCKKIGSIVEKIFIKKVPTEENSFIKPLDEHGNIFQNSKILNNPNEITKEQRDGDLHGQNNGIGNVRLGDTQLDDADNMQLNNMQLGGSGGLGGNKRNEEASVELSEIGSQKTGLSKMASSKMEISNIESSRAGLSRAELSKINLPEIFYPETTEDLVWLLNKLPESVLSGEQKKTISVAMSFESKRVSEIMTPENQIIFIQEHDYMGPLTLSKLYQSGLSHFPVIGIKGEIVGVLHAKTLFSLTIKETDQASAFLDKKVYYMSENYPLKEALLAFIRTGCYFFIVINENKKVTGLLDFKTLMAMVIGDLPKTDFDQDQDIISVAKYAKNFE